MTRINSAIPPASLCDQHLLAEYRELPRLSRVAHAYALLPTERRSKIPPKFCLGKGHVLFFVDKGGFLKDRFESIVNELTKRGFTLNFTDYRPHPEGFNFDHSPTIEEFQLLSERIAERMPKRPKVGKRLLVTT